MICAFMILIFFFSSIRKTKQPVLRQQLQLQKPNSDLNPCAANPVIAATTNTSSESVVTNGQPHHSSQHPSNELSTIAKKTLAEFLAKATGSVMDGIPLPGMKPGPDSIGAFALTRLCGGVVAQAGLVDLEPFKDCRRLHILASFTADRGGLVELVHTQMYAPTTLDAVRDYWTLRYTYCMEDDSLVICERSLASGQGVQEIPVMPGFVRAEMLSSGFLIRPYEQGGAMVIVVDDMNFKSGSLLEGIRPLYTTSMTLARQMTYKVLCHLRNFAKEKAEAALATNNPTIPLRGFSNRLIGGFNDVVNCFPDEGWVSIINDGPSTVSIFINPPPNCKQFGGTESCTRVRNGIICAKAPLLLQGIPPPLLLHFLRKRWIAWADIVTDVELVRSSLNELPKKKPSSLQVLQPIVGQDEVLEVVRVQKTRPLRVDEVFQSDNVLLHLCSMDEIGTGEYSQLIFAPIDASVQDDAPLLPSGFRVMNLGSVKENSATSQTLDLASSREDRSTNNTIPMRSSRGIQDQSSILTITFQYMYKAESRDVIALNVQRHVQALADVLQQAAISLRLHLPTTMTGQCGLEALVLVQQITDSYRTYIGQELLPYRNGDAEGLFRSFWNLKDSVVCCAWKPLPEFIFANQAALDMLETNLSAPRELSLEQMFNDGCRKTDYSQPPPFIQKEGFACLPAGICLTSTVRPVSFERGPLQLGFMFCNWSFASVPI